MLQAIMRQPGKIEFKEIPLPDVKPGQVLIKIMRIGVCKKDKTMKVIINVNEE